MRIDQARRGLKELEMTNARLADDERARLSRLVIDSGPICIHAEIFHRVEASDDVEDVEREK